MQRQKIKQTAPYKIDKGIAMERKREASTRFPFNKMKIGDSFFIPDTDQAPGTVSSSVYSAANSYNRTHNTKIRVAIRKTEGGVRVWRIADKK